jgi:hypothetical protein
LADPKLLSIDVSEDYDVEEGDCFAQIFDLVFAVYCCFEIVDLLKVFRLRDDEEIIYV